jgi:hypothetical protein
VNIFVPIVEYLLERGAVTWAVVLAAAIMLASAAAGIWRAKAGGGAAGPAVTQSGEGPKQATVVADVRSKADVVVAPEQRNR